MSQNDIPRFARMYRPENSLGDASLYLNLGYWPAADSPAEPYDQAAERLVAEVTTLARLLPHDVVLDIGCGLGDQDFWMMKHKQPAALTAINLDPTQIQTCRDRQAASNDAAVRRIDFRVADALALPFAAASFDVVLAIECSQHFHSKEQFFREAYRVLKPGGRLVMSDLLGKQVAFKLTRALVKRTVNTVAPWLYHFPRRNLLLTGADQAELLRDAGFAAVRWTSIYERVIPPYISYCRRYFKSPEFRAKADPHFYFWASLGATAAGLLGIKGLPLDYTLTLAERP